MKAKTIDKRIREKMEDYCYSIKDIVLRDRVKNDIIVTGGCIASMFLKEKVNDYDIYFANITTVFDVAVYYAREFSERGDMPTLLLTYRNGEQEFINPKEPLRIQFDLLTRVEMYYKSDGVAKEFKKKPNPSKKKKYRAVFISPNAITLSNKVQLVLRFWGPPEEIHKSYDFVHATNYWTFKDGLVTNTKALECLLAKELIYTGSRYPFASIFRTRKFIQRGWACHIGNYVKMGIQLNDYNLYEVPVLAEQLTGVDAAYLWEVICAARKKKEADADFKFNSAYLCEIVDRMMGGRK